MRERLLLGLDEAGRGPVLGPMVVAAAQATPTQLSALKDLGLNDSKKLSPQKRRQIFKHIKRLGVQYRYKVISASKLDQLGLTRATNEGLVNLIDALPSPEVFIDAPVGPSGLQKFTHKIKAGVKAPNFKLVAKNRADQTEPVVSAASVVAKYQRDRRLKWLQIKYWRWGNIGSGYTADPRTRRFLVSYYSKRRHWPKEARRTWRTLADLEKETVGFIRRPSWVGAIALGLILVAALAAFNHPSPTPAPLTANANNTVVPVPITEEALVTKVIDGDTVTLKGGQRVRLLAIDTPEVGEPCFEEAKKRLAELTLNKVVNLEADTRDQDAYDRNLRFLYLNDTNVNLTLVKEGLAVAYFFDNVKYKAEIQAAEALAISQRRGCRWRNLP